MSRYTNKFVEFLNGGNTIDITCERDFISLNSMLKKVGLEMFCESYWDLYGLANSNGYLINGYHILVEYQPYKGLTIGYKSFKASEEWFDMKPWKIKEVRDSVRA